MRGFGIQGFGATCMASRFVRLSWFDLLGVPGSSKRSGCKRALGFQGLGFRVEGLRGFDFRGSGFSESGFACALLNPVP